LGDYYLDLASEKVELKEILWMDYIDESLSRLKPTGWARQIKEFEMPLFAHFMVPIWYGTRKNNNSSVARTLLRNAVHPVTMGY
jgi:hypothetical protein